jgi:hypothetical protein
VKDIDLLFFESKFSPMGSPKLEAANQRLKDGGVGFKIAQRGSKLSLRGMFFQLLFDTATTFNG